MQTNPSALISTLRCTALTKPVCFETSGGLSAVSTHAPLASSTSTLTSATPGSIQCAPMASGGLMYVPGAAAAAAAEEEEEEEEEEEDMAVEAEAEEEGEV